MSGHSVPPLNTPQANTAPVTDARDDALGQAFSQLRVQERPAASASTASLPATALRRPAQRLDTPALANPEIKKTLQKLQTASDAAKADAARRAAEPAPQAADMNQAIAIMTGGTNSFAKMEFLQLKQLMQVDRPAFDAVLQAPGALANLVNQEQTVPFTVAECRLPHLKPFADGLRAFHESEMAKPVEQSEWKRVIQDAGKAGPMRVFVGAWGAPYGMQPPDAKGRVAIVVDPSQPGATPEAVIRNITTQLQQKALGSSDAILDDLAAQGVFEQEMADSPALHRSADPKASQSAARQLLAQDPAADRGFVQYAYAKETANWVRDRARADVAETSGLPGVAPNLPHWQAPSGAQFPLNQRMDSFFATQVITGFAQQHRAAYLAAMGKTDTATPREASLRDALLTDPARYASQRQKAVDTAADLKATHGERRAALALDLRLSLLGTHEEITGEKPYTPGQSAVDQASKDAWIYQQNPQGAGIRGGASRAEQDSVFRMLDSAYAMVINNHEGAKGRARASLNDMINVVKERFPEFPIGVKYTTA